ncbi:unnamed protein product [Rotaria sp. Silwood2]|nr:unnamed protein product [Rotaria sp. Silwood2]
MHHQDSEQLRILNGHYDDDVVSLNDITSTPTKLSNALNYATKLLEKFSSMRDKPELSDFRIDINDKHFYCHKFLLIATSDYFKAMFSGNMSESQSDHVELKGFESSSNGVESMINFCYSGSLFITFDNIDELLHAATHLQIKDAIDLCSQFLIESCTIKNCIDIYKISDLYSLNDVLYVIKIFVSKNFVLLMFHACHQFEQLTYEQIYDELSRDRLDIAITVNNYLYVLGTRRSSSEEYKSCYRFSAHTCEWTKLQNLLHDRSRFAAAHVEEYIYIMGGFEGFKRTTRVYVNTIERYSIENDQWESFSTEGPQLSSLAACAYGNLVFLGGGKNGQWYGYVIIKLLFTL